MLRQSFTSLAPRVLPRVLEVARPAIFLAVRNLASKSCKAPGSDPLDIIKKECIGRNLCDDEGYRLPGKHWVISVAVAPEDRKKPPSLRNVGILRVSCAGIDFVMKRGSATSDAIATSDLPIAVLHSQGKYLPGEKSEQWRGEGHCAELPLSRVLDLIPHWTITSLVGSKRLANEYKDHPELLHESVSGERNEMLNKSHSTEVMQKTRIELENGDVSQEELEGCIRAFRFQPDRLECMIGGPESVMWERWEWLRDESDGAPTGAIAWNEAKQLVPH